MHLLPSTFFQKNHIWVLNIFMKPYSLIKNIWWCGRSLRMNQILDSRRQVKARQRTTDFEDIVYISTLMVIRPRASTVRHKVEELSYIFQRTTDRFKDLLVQCCTKIHKNRFFSQKHPEGVALRTDKRSMSGLAASLGAVISITFTLWLWGKRVLCKSQITMCPMVNVDIKIVDK